MACKVAVDDVGGVGVSVEMNDADVAVAMDVGDRGGSWPGDGVVASERDGDDAASGNLVHAVANVGEALVGIAVRAVGVTGVDNGEVVENLEVKVDVIGARFVGRRPDRTGPEPRRDDWWCRCRMGHPRWQRRASIGRGLQDLEQRVVAQMSTNRQRRSRGRAVRASLGSRVRPDSVVLRS